MSDHSAALGTAACDREQPVPSACARAEIERGLSALGLRERVAANPKAVEILAQYLQHLKHWNRHYNLVSRHDTHRLISRHLLDSLSILPYLEGPRIADLGSGAGLPGIPLSIVAPELDITLLERSEKKCRFLRHCVRVLDLPHIHIENIDVLRYHPGYGFDCVVARAVSSPQGCLKLSRHLLRSGGRIVLLCGESTSSIRRESGFCWEKSTHIQVPGLAGKHQIQIYKADSSHWPEY